MKLKNITVQIGGFHDHWFRNGTENPTLLMAAMQYYNYDFICLLDNVFGEKAKWEKKVIESWMPGKRVYLGDEVPYDWGHVVCIENSCRDYNFETYDWQSELKKIHSGGGFVALAHIGYPDEEHQFFKTDEINEVIDNDYTDAVQLEKTKDWRWVQKRAEDGKRLPLVGGWDSHYLTDACDTEKNLYNRNAMPDVHLDSAPGMRTIVFAEDNSLESLKMAIRQGKSVLEHVETGELFGSPELVALLKKENYFEIMKEATEKYLDMELENEFLTAYKAAEIKFPAKGKATFAKDSQLTPVQTQTEEDGTLKIGGMPMPTEQKMNYLPFYWKGECGERLWAVKIFNNIILKTYPSVHEGKRVLIIETESDIKGHLSIKKPICREMEVSGKKGEKIITLELTGDIPDVFECEYCFKALEGGEFTYKKRLGVAVAERAEKAWAQCREYCADSEEYCGGFGSNRPYPGKDVFSGKGQFKWDEKYLYFRCDIVDAIHIPPPSGHFMYRSDCVCISFDPELKRSKMSTDAAGGIFGFPKEGPESTWSAKYEGTAPEMTETSYGRIVDVKIPWEAVNVKNPHKGLVIGLHFSFLNDNGTGLLDNLNWPAPADPGKMDLPEDFGTLYLN